MSSKYILMDSGYWFGLLDPRDPYHSKALAISDLILGHTIIVPFPSLYEVLNSRFIKNKDRLLQFEKTIQSPNVEFIHDEKYKSNALENTFLIHRSRTPLISLVDSIIREMIKDINIRIDYVITFNEKDFKDVCDIRNIEILS